MTRDWLKNIRSYVIMTCGAAAMATGVSRAAEPDADLTKKLEQQQAQIEALQKRLDATEASKGASGGVTDEPAVKAIVADYLKAAEAKKKADEKAKKEAANDEGYKVGTDLKINTRWNPTSGVTFETENKDFTAHIGYRFQLDNVYWKQRPGLNAGTPAGIGDLEDGVFFRRSRPSFDGTAWEVMEWQCELALEQTQNNVPNFDQCYVGIMQIPVIGTVRIGHLKTCQGLDGDLTGSSKALTFLERASFTDAFYENFSTGIMAMNSFCDQRATYAVEAYRQDNIANGGTNSAADFGDGAYGYSARVTALPIWNCDGVEFLHVGGSATYRTNERAAPGTVGPRVALYRARPEQRDAQGTFDGAAGDAAGNSNRLISTAITAPGFTIQSDTETVIGTEAMYSRGPIWVKAEYGWASMNDAATLSTAAPKAVRRGDLWFDGGYIEVGYFLTGEHRTYDRRLGTVASTYLDGPFTPAWLVKTEDGHLSWGHGAWEIAGRFSHTDLNSGVVHGGIEDGLTVGLNWYLNRNLKIQFEYVDDLRHNTPAGVQPGAVQGLGIRTQFFF